MAQTTTPTITPQRPAPYFIFFEAAARHPHRFKKKENEAIASIKAANDTAGLSKPSIIR
jgi:hypothetical protein